MNPDEVVMAQYTIYLDPADLHPGYAVREWLIVRGSRIPVAGQVLAQGLPGLEWARRVVPAGADACLARSDSDDPTVVETWL